MHLWKIFIKKFVRKFIYFIDTLTMSIKLLVAYIVIYIHTILFIYTRKRGGHIHSLSERRGQSPFQREHEIKEIFNVCVIKWPIYETIVR